MFDMFLSMSLLLGTCAYMRVRNTNFSKKSPYVLIEWMILYMKIFLEIRSNNHRAPTTQPNAE